MTAAKYNNRKRNKPVSLEARAKSEGLRYHIFLGLILVYTFALFAKSIHYQFVNWDDNSYILDNMLLRDFSWNGFKAIFSTPVIGMYNPLTISVYAIEYKLWGADSNVFHFFNLLFHLIAVIVVFKFIYELTKRYETSIIVALFFAIHPINVSVITWVSETKTSLCVIFYMIALINYISYIRSNYKIKYLIYTVLFFLLSALCKPSAVTIPPMLFLLDYYLGRKFDKKAILEKIPIFALALLLGLLTFITHIEAEDSIFDFNHDYSLINNILVSNYSIAFYLNKLFVPLQLCTIYPYPPNLPLLSFKYYFSLLIIPFVIWLIYKSGSFRKEMIFGLLFFIISISVKLRVIPSGFFRASNVYAYLSFIGLFFIVGQFFTYIIDNKFPFAIRIKKYVIAFLFFLVVFYSIITDIRIKIWENSITLFNDIIEKKPRLALAYSNRGISRLDIGDAPGALEDISKSIELDPKYAVAYNNRGKILVDYKDYDHALKDLNKALSLNPKYAEAYLNRGNVMFYRAEYDSALVDYNLAIKYNPTIAAAYKNRAIIEREAKDFVLALNDMNKAIYLNPQFYDAYMERGLLNYDEGKLNEALADFKSAIKINPNSGEAYNNKAVLEMMQKDTMNATYDFNKAKELGYGKYSQTN